MYETKFSLRFTPVWLILEVEIPVSACSLKQIEHRNVVVPWFIFLAFKLKPLCFGEESSGGESGGRCQQDYGLSNEPIPLPSLYHTEFRYLKFGMLTGQKVREYDNGLRTLSQEPDSCIWLVKTCKILILLIMCWDLWYPHRLPQAENHKYDLFTVSLLLYEKVRIGSQGSRLELITLSTSRKSNKYS